MNTHKKIRVEIIAEAIHAAPVIDILERAGARGYTMLDVRQSHGRHGARLHDDPSGIEDTVMIVSVVSPEVADQLKAKASQELLKNKAAVVWFSEVEVLRPDHF